MTRKMMWVFCLVLVFTFFTVSVAFAAEEGLGQEAKKFIGLGQGIAISKGLEGIARNPEAQPKIFIPMIVGLALIESLVIYALVISILLYVKL
jgi:ATP synthase F0 subunit c